MKELKVIKFYKDLLEPLDLTAKENGQLFTRLSDKETPLLVGGLPTFLPTRDNIDTFFVNKNGVSEKVKELFNPLSENSIRGANKTFMKFRNIIEYKMLNVFYYVGEALLLISMSKEEINDLNIVKFTSLLSRYKGGASKLIDAKSLELWLKIYQNILNKYNNKKFINILVRKGGLLNNIVYNRVGVITFPLGEDILKLNNKDRHLLDITLRNKDVEVFKTIYEYLIGDDKLIEDGIQTGSLNKKSPSLHTLLLMYDKLYNIFNPIIESIIKIGVDEDMAKMLELKKLPFDIANLSEIIDSYETDVIKIPTDLNVPVATESIVTPTVSNNFNTNSSNGTVVKEEPSISNGFNMGRQQVDRVISSPFGDVKLPNNNQQTFINNQPFNDSNAFTMGQRRNNIYQQQFNNSNNNFKPNNMNQATYSNQQTFTPDMQRNNPVIVNRHEARSSAGNSRYNI